MFILNLIFALIIFINGAYASENQWILGNEWTKQIRDNFEKGEYNSFLTQLHKRYIKGIGQGEWKLPIKQSPILNASDWKKLGEKRKYEDYQKQFRYYRASLSRILTSTNRELERIAKEDSQSFLLKVIFEYVDYKEDPSIHDMASNEAFTEKCERLFFDIAHEGEVKRLILYSSVFGNIDLQLPEEKFEEYGLVIGLEEYKQMLNLAQSDPAFHQALTKNFNQYLLLAAKNHNFSYLLSLTHLKDYPSETEFEVAELVRQLVESRRDLLKKHQLVGLE